MSTNNIPANLATVDKLLQRIAVAERSQQKEVRITIQEARDLTTELSLLTTKLGTTVAERSQQKEVRITIQEARDLTTELSLLTTKLGSTVAEIHNMLKEIKQSTTEVDVKFDGGSF